MRVFLVLFSLVTVTCWAQAASGQPSAPLVNTVSSPLPEAEPRLQTDSVIQLLEAEPSVRQVQQWALSEVGLARRWERDMIRDARARGGLPLIRLRGRYQDVSKRDWDEVNLLEGRDHRADYTVDLWLEWDLADLASSGEVLRAVRESRATIELRQAIVHRVTIDYFDRRRLRVEELVAGPEDLEASLDRRLRLQELDATLDGLTGGRWALGLAEAVKNSLSDSPEVEEGLSPVAGLHGDRRQPGGQARKDLDPRLRLPVHPTDRSSDP